jgi:hypothetical protein
MGVTRQARVVARRVRVQDGAVVDMRPDHYARLTAVSRLLQVPAAGRPIRYGIGTDELGL